MATNCNHRNLTWVGTTPDTRIALYAGSQADMLEAAWTRWEPHDAVINALGRSLPVPAYTVHSFLPTQRTQVYTFPRAKHEIVIPWEDGAASDLTVGAWRALSEHLRTLAAESHDTITVVVHCHAGHGRTGTVLAILGTLWGLIPPEKDPIQWVRDNYCQRAVETDAQVAYVCRVLAIESGCKGTTTNERTPYVAQKTLFTAAPVTQMSPEDDDLEVYWSWTEQGYVDLEGNPLGDDWDKAVKKVRRRKHGKTK